MDNYQIGGIILLVMVFLILIMTIVIAGFLGNLRMVLIAPVRSVSFKSDDSPNNKLVLGK